MGYQQKDLVWLHYPLPLPDGTNLPHPVLIISSNKANSRENHFTGIMMTALSYRDSFSFSVTNEMFESPLHKQNCQLRLYIIVSFREVQIKKLANRMRKIDFINVLNQVKDYVFSCDS